MSKQGFNHRARRWLPSALILVSGATLAIWAAGMVHEAHEDRTRLSFVRRVDARVHTLRHAFASQLEIVRSVSTLLQVSPNLTRDQFGNFAAPFLIRHPTLQALEWIPRVSRETRRQHEERARLGGHPDFEFTEREPETGSILSAASRSEYFPVYYVEPVEGNERAIGFDLGSSPARREALNLARDTGKLTATGRIRLVQEVGHSYGFLVVASVYAKGQPIRTISERRDALLGFALAVMRVTDLVTGLVPPTERKNQRLDIRILDADAPVGRRLLYPPESHEDMDPEAVSQSLEMAGRTWMVNCSRPNGEQLSAWDIPYLITLVGGFSLSIGAAAYVLFLASREATIRQEVASRTLELQGAKKCLEWDARELQRLNTRLVDKNAELDEFTYMASHDLKEPLRKLQAFSGLLKKDIGTDLNEHAERDIDFIMDSSQQMESLINDLLGLSRVGRAELRMEKVSLNDCVDEALILLSARVNESGAKTHRQPLPEVVGDSRMLIQLYQNLIGNACKFVNGTSPEVVLTCEHDGGNTVFGVRDNGIGLDPAHAERIFHPFTRLHGRGEYDGSGIGLAICRKAVERHGGKLWVSSSPGMGAHFKFTLAAESTP